MNQSFVIVSVSLYVTTTHMEATFRYIVGPTVSLAVASIRPTSTLVSNLLQLSKEIIFQSNV